jgi:hypothetical protein
MRLIFLAMLLLCSGLAQAGGPGRESYTGSKPDICLEFAGDRFGFNMVVRGGEHVVSGDGVLAHGKKNELVLNFDDSFGNKVTGTFNKGTGKLSLSSTREMGDESAAMVSAYYGDYVLKRRKCKSDVF